MQRMPYPAALGLENPGECQPPSALIGQLAGKSRRPLRTRISDAILVIPFGFYSANVNRVPLRWPADFMVSYFGFSSVLVCIVHPFPS